MVRFLACRVMDYTLDSLSDVSIDTSQLVTHVTVVATYILIIYHLVIESSSAFMFRYLKSTLGNIKLINSFRKEELTGSNSRDKLVLTFLLYISYI